MDLYVIRHADAAALGQCGAADDADRPLTAEGEEQSRHLAVGLQRKGIRFTTVLSSPLLRARQTAERMLADWAAPAPRLTVCDELTPGTKARKVARALFDLNEESVALVGHQPDLGEWSAWLIGSRRAQVDFSKGGVAYLHCEEPPAKGAATLVWLVTHDWFAL